MQDRQRQSALAAAAVLAQPPSCPARLRRRKHRHKVPADVDGSASEQSKGSRGAQTGTKRALGFCRDRRICRDRRVCLLRCRTAAAARRRCIHLHACAPPSCCDCRHPGRRCRLCAALGPAGRRGWLGQGCDAGAHKLRWAGTNLPTPSSTAGDSDGQLRCLRVFRQRHLPPLRTGAGAGAAATAPAPGPRAPPQTRRRLQRQRGQAGQGAGGAERGGEDRQGRVDRQGRGRVHGRTNRSAASKRSCKTKVPAQPS